MNFLKKYMEICCFFSNVLIRWYFQKQIALEYDLFCNIRKDGASFFSKIWYFFFRRKMKDDLSQTIHGNMIFSVYKYKCYKYNITLLPKKAKAITWKNTLKGDISGITEKDDIYPRKHDFCWNIILIAILDWHSRKSFYDSLYFIGVFIYCFPVKKTRKLNI